MSKIFNIPANYHFLETLAYWLEERFGEKIGEATILLPSRRSCRELRRIFTQKNRAGFLPKIKTISDLSYEDFFDFREKEIVDELLETKVLDGIDQLLFLTSEIQKQHVFGEMNFEQAFKIALHLKGLFEDLEREQIDAKKFLEIDDSDISKHRQITLEFIRNFYGQIKNSLLKKDYLFTAAWQNFLLQKFTNCLRTKEFPGWLIVAGSTGSMVTSRNLIKEISQLKNGLVVLQSAWSGNFSQENHPQFFLSQLVRSLGTAATEIKKEEFKLSDEGRQNLISTLMMPSEETERWQKISLDFDWQNLRILEAKNEIEEAKTIAEILAKNSQEQKKSALITNNNTLANLVSIELQRQQAEFNDSRNRDIFDSALINFLLLILEVSETNFNSHSLLALLKHPLCIYSKNQKFLAEFEINILRHDRELPGLAGISAKLESVPELEKLFSDFLNKFDSQLLKSAENLSQKTWQELLADEPAQKEISEFFHKILASNYSPNSSSELKTLLGQISYFEKSDSLAPIQILSTIEARLLNFDLVIVASLNEGDFPAIESENWLGKKIRKDLGIDHTQKKIGQNAHDFCNYLANKSVILSRSRSRNGVALIESPFLLKLKTLFKKAGIKIDEIESLKLDPQLRLDDMAEENKAFAPLPPKFSLTEISQLIADPYSIYAKKILQLDELKKIDYEPGYAEFGSFVHKALEEFVKNNSQQNFSEFFEKYFSSKEAKLIWWPKFEKIFSDFIERNSSFADKKSEVERAVKIEIGNVLISGKVDRIIFDSENQAQIFDYKTGQTPTKKDVLSGVEPQLTIAALAMSHEYLVNSLNYWKLSYSSEGKITNICKSLAEISELVEATKRGIERLFDYFASEKSHYHITKKTKEGKYKNLAR